MGSPIETLIRNKVAKGVEAIAGLNRNRTLPHASATPFLSGIHAPMTQEFVLEELAVTGRIPEGLSGRYLRNGPNPVDADPKGYHWFVGDGMIHALAIDDGKALWYRNRWIRSNAVASALGEQPAPGPRHHAFDTVNTNIVRIGGRDFALIEAGSYPVELDETLGEQHYNPFDGTLKGSFTAHPHLDPKTGEHHAICYDGRDPGVIRHVAINSRGQVIREEPITVQHGPMIHDCAITDRYVVILDLPVTFSMKAMQAGQGLPYRWNPEHEARVGLLPRQGRQEDIIWCSVAPGYVFHVANAFDDADGRVVLDVCAYDTMFGEGAKGPGSRCRGLERWIVDPASGDVTIRTLDARPQEFPRNDERYFGQDYRYLWTMALPTDPAERFVGSTALYAYDLVQGTRKTHDFGAGRHPGEFVFVPEHAEGEEGDGWLVGFVVDLGRQTTDLVILDARNFEGDPVASIHLPHRIPPGFHGNWIARERTK